MALVKTIVENFYRGVQNPREKTVCPEQEPSGGAFRKALRVGEQLNNTIMSSISSTTINVNVQNLQPAYTALGMGNIPAGTSVAMGISGLEKTLLGNLANGWPSVFAPYASYQQNDGIMEPWSDNVGGTAPSCVTQQIISSFNGWELPYSSDAVNQIASEITQNIAANGGQTGTFYGRTALAGGETLYWGVSYATAVVIGPPTNATGIIYAFSAAIGFN